LPQSPPNLSGLLRQATQRALAALATFNAAQQNLDDASLGDQSLEAPELMKLEVCLVGR